MDFLHVYDGTLVESLPVMNSIQQQENPVGGKMCVSGDVSTSCDGLETCWSVLPDFYQKL